MHGELGGPDAGHRRRAAAARCADSSPCVTRARACSTETGEQRHEGLWFIAHEAAHFWLGQTVGYEYARDAWITEGGAELLAFRAVAEVDPEYDPRIPLNRAIEDCIGLTRRPRRGERAASAANSAPTTPAARCSRWWPKPRPARSFYKFARRLVDTNRADGVVSRAEWLAALDAGHAQARL